MLVRPIGTELGRSDIRHVDISELVFTLNKEVFKERDVHSCESTHAVARQMKLIIPVVA